jgi:hypothetical protein
MLTFASPLSHVAKTVGCGLALALAATALSGFAAAPASPSAGPHLAVSPIDNSASGDVAQSTPYADELASLSDSLSEAGLVTRFSDVFSGLVFDGASKTLSVKYTATAASGRVEQFLELLGTIKPAGQVTPAADPVEFNYAVLEQKAQEISQNGPSWAKKLGVSSITAAGVDLLAGQVTVYTSDQIPADREITVDSIRVRVSGSASRVDFQSR